MTTNPLVSVCCGAPVDYNRKILAVNSAKTDGETYFYICSSCQKACNAIRKTHYQESEG